MNNRLDDLIPTIRRIHTLKVIQRVGWQMEGLSAHETVAAHCHSVCVITLLVGAALRHHNFTVDISRALQMAILHDVGESMTGELATAVKRGMRSLGQDPDQLETMALSKLFRDIPNADELNELFRDYNELESAESKLVKFADVFDAILEARAQFDRFFPDFVENSLAKLRRGASTRDGGLGDCLADWLEHLTRSVEVSGSSQQEWQTAQMTPLL